MLTLNDLKAVDRSTLFRVYPIDTGVGMLFILAFKYLVCDKDLLIVSIVK